MKRVQEVSIGSITSFLSFLRLKSFKYVLHLKFFSEEGQTVGQQRLKISLHLRLYSVNAETKGCVVALKAWPDVGRLSHRPLGPFQAADQQYSVL